MKQGTKIIRIQSHLSFRLDPTLSGEEGIVLRALAGGQTDRQVCRYLRLDPMRFLRMMRDMREKTGFTDNVSLIEWAKGQIKGGDRRIEGKYGRLA